MNPDHSFFADWDAAYALGALSADDRRAFEAHLASCGECRRAVAELTPTVGLLSRLTPDDARRVAADAGSASGEVGRVGPDPALRAGVVRLDAARRARRRRTTWIAAAAAVVLVAAAVVAPIALTVSAPPSVAMASVSDVPLEASVSLAEVAWGTRIELECGYPRVAGVEVPEGGWTYLLTVVGREGEGDTVSSWRASPGTSARLSAGTALALDEISAIEIRSATGTVLMRYSLDG